VIAVRLLTIPQPRATLIAVGRIVFDTRPEPTGYRGPIAIHAARSLRTELGLAALEEPMKGVLAVMGHTLATLPRGAVIAVGELVDCVQIVYGRDGHILPPSIQEDAFKEIGLGQWQAGGFAYRFANVRALETPIEAVKGSGTPLDYGAWLLEEIQAQLQATAG
jgi:hypothetical protein